MCLQGHGEAGARRAVQPGVNLPAGKVETVGRQDRRATVVQLAFIAGAVRARGGVCSHAQGLVGAGGLVGGVGNGQGHGELAIHPVVMADLLATGHIAVAQSPVPGRYGHIITGAAGIQLTDCALAISGEGCGRQAVDPGAVLLRDLQ